MAISFCGIDPGFSGGISIVGETGVKVFKMPVIKNEKKVKGKVKTTQSYDLLKIREIFREFLDENSIILLERVASRPGEGSVSSFNFGRGFGNLEGVVIGLFNKYPIKISPVKWKQDYPELSSDSFKEKKIELKSLSDDNKIKEKTSKKENKKLIDKLNREMKSEAKTAARVLASKLYPDMAECFMHKNTDGVAESLLISLYGRNHQSELVQDS